MSNVRIDIASEFDAKGFRNAEKATNSLDKAVGKLSKKLTAAFSVYKIAQFGKESVQAFAKDQQAAAVLAKTLENVNQGYQTDMVNAYIAKTEALYGVLDDKLRPAFAQLVVATGDATKSQELLQTALDVSAGTGKDLESVTAALSKAYLGNTTALQRLGVGLSKADLSGKSFNQILTILNQNFAGQAATAADTYQGKIDRLNVAFENMKETIGKGIIDSLGQLNTDQGFNGVIEKMGSLAQDISDIILGLGVIANKLQSLPGMGVLGDILKFNVDHGLLGILKNLGATQRTKNAQPAGITNFLSDMKNIAAATAKANGNAKQLLTTSKNLTKEAKDKLALDKASLALKQAEGIFNLDKIETEAALLQKQSNEDYARLQLKKDLMALQDAINAGDAKAATALADAVNADYKRVQAFQAQNVALAYQNGLITNMDEIIKQFPDAKKLIDLDNLNAALDKLNQMLALLTSMGAKSSVSSSAAASMGGGTSVSKVYGPANPNLFQGSGVYDYKAPDSYGFGNPNLYAATGAYGQPVQITIVDNTSGLIDVVTDATQQASASGISTRIIRNTGGLNW